MESNKDESLKCLKLSRKYLDGGSFDKAIKFALKSKRLYPLNEADDLIADIERRKKESTPGDSKPGESEGVRQRRKSHSSSNGTASSEPLASGEPEYTPEQHAAVKRIKKCKDYYEILSVSKDASESDLKKSYRKLALQFHPDKNKAPGATEAFKAIGNAYATLSDSSKRKQYDVYGEEEARQPRRRNGHSDYTHGFEAEVSPEELFNMFFGGSAFNTYHRQTRPRYQEQHHQQRRERHNESALSAFFQLSPIIMMVLISLLSIALQGDDLYKFHKSQSYPIMKTTNNFKVQYFVKESFSKSYTGRSLQKVEKEIEQIYINNLKNECYREQMQREQLRWKARYRNDGKAYEEAGRMKMTNCDKLEEIYG